MDQPSAGAEPESETPEPEFEIVLGPTRVLGPVSGPVPRKRPDTICETVGRHHWSQSRVFVALSAWQAAREHVKADGFREHGGILWGLPSQDANEPYLEVTEARPANAARGDLGQLTFGHEAWQEVLQEQTPGRRVVGWYHSHPGFGVFLSEQDSFIQRNFFAQPWQIALVLDPHAGTWGVYGWVKGQIAPWTGFELFATTAERDGLREEARQARRARG